MDHLLSKETDPGNRDSDGQFVDWPFGAGPGDTWRGELARFASQNKNEDLHKLSVLSDPAFRARGA